MIKLSLVTGLAAVLWGCVLPATAWKGNVEWPEEHSARLVAPPMEAGAALAAAAAIREMIRENLATDPDLFWGCSSPEQGLDVVVFTGPTPGLYYVVLHQRFHRCSGPSGRVLDGWYEYAVTPQGEVVGKAPPPPAEDFFAPSPTAPSPPEQTPTPSTIPAGETPAPIPPAPTWLKGPRV
jgi:hypothetical protein